jgi:hypothetical protein
VKISLGLTSGTDALKNLLDSLPRSHIYDITADSTVRTWFKPDAATAATNSNTTSPSANTPASNRLTRSRGARGDEEADTTHNRNQTAAHPNYENLSTAPTDDIYNMDITTSHVISPQTTETSNHTDTGNDLVRGPYGVATTRTFQIGRNDEVDCTERSNQSHNKTNGISGSGPSEDKNTERPRRVKNTRHSIFPSTPMTSMTSTEPRTTKKAKYSSLHDRLTESDPRVVPEKGGHSSAQDRSTPITSMTSTEPRMTKNAKYSSLHDRLTESDSRVVPEKGGHSSAQEQQPIVSSNENCPRLD